jgi:HK97 family phage prohead protease
MLKQKIHAPLRIKAVNDAGEFSGYGSVFGTTDSYGDVVVKGAFNESLVDWASKGRMPSLLWQHDTKEPIGVYTKMNEDDEGLYVEGRLLIDDDPLAKRAHAHLKAGSLSGMSIGYSLPEGGWHYDSEKDVFVLTKIDLWEVSLVTFPANDEARVAEVKSVLSHGQTPSIRQVEHCLRDVGFSARQAKALIADGYSGINPRDEGKDAELIQTIKSLTQTMRA